MRDRSKEVHNDYKRIERTTIQTKKALAEAEEAKLEMENNADALMKEAKAEASTQANIIIDEAKTKANEKSE